MVLSEIKITMNSYFSASIANRCFIEATAVGTTLRVKVTLYPLFAHYLLATTNSLGNWPLVLTHLALGGAVVRTDTGALVFIVLFNSCGQP